MAEMLLPDGVTPPHSDEAEQSVLGSVLLDNAAWDAVGNRLLPAHFYRADHRAIFNTIGGLVTAHKLADPVTVMEAGGHDLGYLTALLQSVITPRHAGHHAEIVLERWRERELMRLGVELVEDARGGGAGAPDTAVIIDRLVQRLLELNAGKLSDRAPVPVAELAADYVDYITEVYEGRIVTIPTRLRDLDHITAEGIRDGELWVFGARPSMGKTALTNTLARNMCSPKRAALFLSQEDSLRALMARNVAALGRVNLADLRNPKTAPSSMWDGLSAGVEALSQLNMYLDDQTGLSLADVRRKIQQVKRKSDVGIVVVDYLQLMEGDGDNRNIELGKIANGLKKAAKEFDVGVMLLSQMNREADKRQGNPIVSDLRDSGDIEGAADLIGLLWREHKYRPTEANKHYAALEIAKQKNGPTGTVNLFFDGAYQYFADWDGPAPMSQGVRKAAHSGGMD